MNHSTIIGVDLAKHIFQVCVLNKHHKVISNTPFKRDKFVRFIQNQSPCTFAVEACGSAHYWAKRMIKAGHKVKMIPPNFVKGFTYGNKHDKNDAGAIALAATQPDAPKVNIKSETQQVLQTALRIRERRVAHRTDIINQIRSICYEQGCIIPRGIAKIRHLDYTIIPGCVYELVCELLEEFKVIDKRILENDKKIHHFVYHHPLGKKLLEVPGIGIINALACLIINPADFNNGRHFSAYLGLVPKITGSGGIFQLRGISKRGNRYHRTLMIHAARAWMAFSKDKSSKLYLWVQNIRNKRGFKVAVTALANKLARIIWHILQGKSFNMKLAAA